MGSLVIYVDDSRFDIDLMKMAFNETKVSFQMLFVNNGVELLTLLEDRKIASQVAFIVLDQNMPMMTGLETFEKMKTYPKLKHIHTLLFTTTINPKTIKQVYELGMITYLNKPMNYKCLECFLRMVDNFFIKPFNRK